MTSRPTIDLSFERKITPQDLRGFPNGNFLIRACHSRSGYYGCRLLQVANRSRDQAAEIMAWVDESKGELKEAERLDDHNNQVFYLDEDGRLRSKARPQCLTYCRINPDTRDFELILRPVDGQSEEFTRRACQFSYDGTSKAITVSMPTADGAYQETFPDNESVASFSSALSLSDVMRKSFVLEMVPQRHHSTMVRFWNYYTGSSEDDEHSRNAKTAQAAAQDAPDDSWHRGRGVRVVAVQEVNGCALPPTPFQQWDLIPLVK
ncbi:hypothetical protein RhiJN_22157 [Ceratobasidium sp. AG-Ba]|nr:hypothetical protein RhiJN_22157 [Ceratobasidium sp. AG-Ba]